MEKQDLAKIAITPESDSALAEALEKINIDNQGGRVTKIDLASWFLLKSSENLDASRIEEIRGAHFNQVAYLEGLLKRIKKSGRDTISVEEIAKLQALSKQHNAKSKKSSIKSNVISNPALKATKAD
jgi:hypothetical protein